MTPASSGSNVNGLRQSSTSQGLVLTGGRFLTWREESQANVNLQLTTTAPDSVRHCGSVNVTPCARGYLFLTLSLTSHISSGLMLV